MAFFKPENHRTVSMAASRSLIMTVAAGALFLAAPASAQQPVKPAPASAPTPAKKTGDASKTTNSAWVKLCEKQKGEKKGNIYLTHPERFRPTSGQPLISAAIRQVDGGKQDMVMVMVPLGRLLQSGLILKVDEEKGKNLNYSFCTSVNANLSVK